MSRDVRFHEAFPTEIDCEISLADTLYSAGIVRHGRDGLRTYLRTDPSGFFGRCHYVRLRRLGETGVESIVAAGFKGDDALLGYATKATVTDILTPSHHAYAEFSDRLLSLLVSEDYEWNYAPAGDEYWPLASAEIIRAMGFAVAETLTLFHAFLGDTDHGIYDHVEGLWRRTKPKKGKVAFDATPPG